MRRFFRIQNAKVGLGPATSAERSKAYRTRAKERARTASIEDLAWLARYESARSNASVLREKQSEKIPPKRLESAKAVARRIVRSTPILPLMFGWLYQTLLLWVLLARR